MNTMNGRMMTMKGQQQHDGLPYEEMGYCPPPNRKLPPVPGQHSNYNTIDRIKNGRANTELKVIMVVSGWDLTVLTGVPLTSPLYQLNGNTQTSGLHSQRVKHVYDMVNSILIEHACLNFCPNICTLNANQQTFWRVHSHIRDFIYMLRFHNNCFGRFLPVFCSAPKLTGQKKLGTLAPGNRADGGANGPQYDEIPYGDVPPPQTQMLNGHSGKGQLPDVPAEYSQVPNIPARQGMKSDDRRTSARSRQWRSRG